MGVDIFVLLVRNKKYLKLVKIVYKLFVVNGIEICIYGECIFEFNLGLWRWFRWIFVVVDVNILILGVDFLVYYKLLVDLYWRKFIDCVIEFSVNIIKINSFE